MADTATPKHSVQTRFPDGDKRLIFRLSPTMHSWLREKSQETGISMSSLIRMALIESYENDWPRSKACQRRAQDDE